MLKADWERMTGIVHMNVAGESSNKWLQNWPLKGTPSIHTFISHGFTKDLWMFYNS